MPSIKMTINLPDSVRKMLQLAPWGNRQATNAICKTIDRYNLILKPSKFLIKEMFSLAELNLFYELCKDKKFVPAEKCKDEILLQVVNASDEIFDLSGLDRNEIKNKLQNLSVIQNVALVEVIEDFAE